MDGLDTILKSEKCDCFKDVKPSGCSFAMKNGIAFLCCNKCGKIIRPLDTKEEHLILQLYEMMKDNKITKITITRRKENDVGIKTSELFKKEIAYISNEILQNIVRDTLDAAPECIQTIPASSSGKFHPKADSGDGGLVRHVRAVTAIAKTMIDTDIFKNMALGTGADDYETITIYADIALAACILHDCMKPDDSPKHRTVFDHPLKAANLFKETAKKYITKENMNYMKVVIPLVHSSIASHMGQWTTAPYAKGIVLPKPKLGIEQFVHLCDYIASRKFIDFNFEVYDGMK